MDFSLIPIKQLIPQRPPIMMVDKVISCDEVDARTTFKVNSDNIFLENNRFTAPGIIENMAQSCAARMGCIDLLHDKPIKIGYIGDIRDAEIIMLPQVGETLYTEVHVSEDIFDIVLAEVIVKSRNSVIARARMKVAKTDIVAKLKD